MGAAQTGTGKTAGFTLPLLQFLAPDANTSLSPARHPTRVLILTPTRELAAQVEESVRIYGKYLPLRTAVVYGGVDIDPQIKALARRRRKSSSPRRGACSITCTRKRSICRASSSSCSTKPTACSTWGSCPTSSASSSVLPTRRQNLLFSATFPEEIRRLAKELLHAPVTVEVAPRNAPPELVTHQVYMVPPRASVRCSTHLIRGRDMRQVLVFVRMKRDANRLARELQRDGIATPGDPQRPHPGRARCRPSTNSRKAR